MSGQSENYRGRTIRVVRDDNYPIVALVDVAGRPTITFNSVAQARRHVDHLEDRSCVAHIECADQRRTA